MTLGGALDRVQESAAAWRHRDDVRAVLHRFEGDAFHRIRSAHAARFNAKYLEAERWIRKTSKRVFRLGLHRSRPLDILDIGTGCGYFPLICNYYGHRAIGTDLGGDPLYGDVLAHLRLRSIPWRIEPFEPAPEGLGRFDLVTAFMVVFNTPRRNPWGPNRWGFFLDDLTDRVLRPGGRLALVLNRPARGFVTPELHRCFEARGGVVNGSRVDFLRGVRQPGGRGGRS